MLQGFCPGSGAAHKKLNQSVYGDGRGEPVEP
jgi:hypothetical protein